MSPLTAGSLRELIDAAPDSPFSPDDVRSYARQTLKALAFIHEEGFVHADVKPENLLYFDDDTIKICDLGLAHQLRAGAEHVPKGTYPFMSPEVLRLQEADTKVRALRTRI